MAFQVFISYARDDDKVPPLSTDGKGFVAALRDQLDFEFTNLGGEVPRLWWDRRSIEPHEQFDPVIQEGIDSSDLLMVILSRNWLARPWCRRELDLFAERWRDGGERKVRERIWVVSKQYVDPERRPALLCGQSSYEFFFRERNAREGDEQEYFRQGKPQEGYHEIVKRLAVNLWRRAQSADMPSEAHKADAAPKVDRLPRRTIYVATPSRDIRWAYLRVVSELRGRNYRVVPPPEEALDQSEASIHLLGLDADADNPASVTNLQLERAAKRAAESGSFKRIIWAPRVLIDEDGRQAGDAERDPLAVVAGRTRQLESDKIDGSDLTAFVEFVLQHLERTSQPQRHVEEHGKRIAAGSSVYIEFAERDVEYGLECMEALQQRDVYTQTPAFDKTEPAKTRAVNRQKLRECDAVVLCWATAPDNWVDFKEEELKNTSQLGRERPFAMLVVGPPPDTTSKRVRLKRRNRAIDVTVDLSRSPTVPPEAFDPVIES